MSSSTMTLALQNTFPPQTQCWASVTSQEFSFHTAAEACKQINQTVTEPMVDYLNITQDIETYFQSYSVSTRSLEEGVH
jgi:hypothetical protein